MGEFRVGNWFASKMVYVEADNIEYQKIIERQDVYEELLSLEEKFDALLENFAQLEREIFSEGLEASIFNSYFSNNYRSTRAKIGRLVLNVLATSRLYLDALRQHGTQVIGVDFSSLEKLISAEYDKSISYRCMELLRNHAQHYDLPVASNTIAGRKVHDSEGLKWAKKLSPKISKASLLRNSRNQKGKNRRVVDEAFAVDEDAELMPHLRAYIESLTAFQSTFRTYCSPRKESLDNAARALFDRFKESYPSVESSWIGIGPADESFYSEKVIHVGEDDFYDYLVGKNSGFQNLSRRYVEW